MSFSAFILSYCLNLVFIIFARRSNLFLDDRVKPQKIHDGAVPRIGGVGIFLASLVIASNPLGKKVILAAFPAFFVGFLEDLMGDISPKIRLMVIMFSAALGVHLLGVAVNDLEFFSVPIFLSVPLTLLLVTGVTNAVNIIDGLNGLASGFCLIALASFGVVAYSLGDNDLMFIFPRLALAVMGFFVLNFPKGQIFLGDSGAYFLGFVTVLLGLLLIDRNAGVSKFFPLLIMFYPIWEVLFSIYRRRIIKQAHATSADKLHLHTLLYKRTSLGNPGASLVLLFFVGVISVFSVALADRSIPQIIGIVLFVIAYRVGYQILVSFKIKTKTEKIIPINLSGRQ